MRKNLQTLTLLLGLVLLVGTMPVVQASPNENDDHYEYEYEYEEHLDDDEDYDGDYDEYHIKGPEQKRVEIKDRKMYIEADEAEMRADEKDKKLEYHNEGEEKNNNLLLEYREQNRVEHLKMYEYSKEIMLQIKDKCEDKTGEEKKECVREVVESSVKQLEKTKEELKERLLRLRERILNLGALNYAEKMRLAGEIDKLIDRVDRLELEDAEDVKELKEQIRHMREYIKNVKEQLRNKVKGTVVSKMEHINTVLADVYERVKDKLSVEDQQLVEDLLGRLTDLTEKVREAEGDYTDILGEYRAIVKQVVEVLKKAA